MTNQKTKLPQMHFQNCALPISPEFYKVIRQQVHLANILPEAESVTIHFRDTSYTAETGGFHPVEISMLKGNQGKWCISYITDFAYYGLDYSELERDIDFDLGNNMAFAFGIGWQNINSSGFVELYQAWEDNFLAYIKMEAFDEIKVSVN